VTFFKHTYRHYGLLMGICFWLSVLWLAWVVLGRLIPGLADALDPIRGLLRAVFNFNVLFAMFLVTARFMRDEYAEKIWQQTARRFVNFIVVGPLILIIAIAVFSQEIRAALPQLLPARLIELVSGEDQPEVVFFSGIAATFVIVVQFVPQFFVIFYRWSLWRDSR
jgi:uncharacterized membrane protein